jgi:hypothetical protein
MLKQEWGEVMMWMFGEMNVGAEVCRRQHKTIARGGGGGWRVSREHQER